MILELGNCIQEALHFDDADDLVERAQLGAHHGDEIESGRAREPIAVLCGEFPAQPSLGQLAALGQRGLSRDEQQAAGANGVDVVRGGRASGGKGEAELPDAMLGAHRLSFETGAAACSFACAIFSSASRRATSESRWTIFHCRSTLSPSRSRYWYL